MTIETPYEPPAIAGNGSTTGFTVPFQFFENAVVVARLVVDATLVVTLWVETVDYTLTGAGDPNGGTLTATVAPATGETLVITRETPVQQKTVYPPNDDFDAARHERDFDLAVMRDQEQDARIALGLIADPTGTFIDVGGARIINLGEPIAGTDASTKNYVDAVFLSGISGTANVDALEIGDGDHNTPTADQILSVARDGALEVQLHGIGSDVDLVMRRANGTKAARTKVLDDEALGTLFANGFDGTDYIAYTAMQSVAVDTALGSENGKWALSCLVNGTLTNLLTLTGGGTTPALRPSLAGDLDLGDETNPFRKSNVSTRSYIGHGADINTHFGEPSALQIAGTTYGQTSAMIGRFTADDLAGELTFTKSRSTDPAIPTIVQIGDNLGNIRWAGDDGVGDPKIACSIRARVRAPAPASGAVNGAIVFQLGGENERLEFSEIGHILAISSATSQHIGDASGNAFDKGFFDTRLHLGYGGDLPNGFGTTNGVQIAGSDLEHSSALIGRFSNNDLAGEITFLKSRAAAAGDPATIVQLGDNLGNIRWAGDDGVGDPKIACSIRARVRAPAPASGAVNGAIVFQLGGENERLELSELGHILAISVATDQDIGSNTGDEFRDGFFLNAITVTSDRTLKRDERDLALAELTAFGACGRLMKSFRWKNEAAGQDRRTGPMAQDVETAFVAQSLDVNSYSLMNTGKDGIMRLRMDELQNGIIASYAEELDALKSLAADQALLITAQAEQLANFEDRIAALEAA
ncbi:MAG: hypothetical protein V3W41_22400 [Planctomycetota bacterium]